MADGIDVQKELEIILTRQLASALATPIFIVDPEGTLLYYNEPAELVLGRRFEETGAMAPSQWGTMFEPFDEKGNRIPPENLALVVSVREHRPMHGSFYIRAKDGITRMIEVTAFPLISNDGRFLGAVAVFWELAAE